MNIHTVSASCRINVREQSTRINIRRLARYKATHDVPAMKANWLLQNCSEREHVGRIVMNEFRINVDTVQRLPGTRSLSQRPH